MIKRTASQQRHRNQTQTSWIGYDQWKGGEPHTAVGTILVRERLWSPQLHNHRSLLIYLPPSYARDAGRRHPVIYMQDGQNLFDEATSYSSEWHVDETLQRLSGEGIEAIVVGIPHGGGQRLVEYGPFDDPEHGAGRADDYLAFVAGTVKPLVDGDFRTLPGREHAGILGSSMGGLLSIYAFFRLPHLFGFAGVMSPALWYASDAIFPFVEGAPYNPGRVYMDAGTRELGGGPADKGARTRSRRYYASVRRMKRLLVRKGYRPQHDLLVVEDQWAGHNEDAWASR
ncbi:MAG: alpha/beta hydrolase-fold protein, partial [Anaerolineae bacterium]|nr:alpha/beta hydrolase-fold protein [Anaerolineae bacterium]